MSEGRHSETFQIYSSWIPVLPQVGLKVTNRWFKKTDLVHSKLDRESIRKHAAQPRIHA